MFPKEIITPFDVIEAKREKEVQAANSNEQIIYHSNFELWFFCLLVNFQRSTGKRSTAGVGELEKLFLHKFLYWRK